MCARILTACLRAFKTKNHRGTVFGTLAAALVGCLIAPAQGAGPADFLVDQLSLTQFRQRMIDLSTIPAFVGSPTPSRHWEQPGNTVAVEYIRNEFVSYGYTNVTLDPYTFNGETRHNIYATKVGTVSPTQMYIVSGHMDSINFSDFTNAPGFDDDGSGASLVMELARVFAKARTDISVRFICWNNEETGLNGSGAYASAHRALQGTLTEPTWLGVIQSDMILYDHFPVPDADVEFQINSVFAAQSEILANAVAGAMARYGTMPAEVSNNMNNTDSKPFQNDVAAISLRENRRIAEIGNGSNPHWHRDTDRLETYTVADLEFGFNIVKMAAGAVAELVGAEPDCNMNNISDADDITAGAADVNSDGIPDVCQDCNGNTTLDPIEVANNTVPDCNANGIPDACDITAQNSNDCNTDGIPDECQTDCQPNFVPDDCDIAGTFSNDCNGSGVPDECENLKPSAPTPGEFATNRYLTFLPNDPGQQTAIRVTVSGLSGPHAVLNGKSYWIGPPQVFCENSGQVNPPQGGCGPAPGLADRTFIGAALQCTPFFMDWHGVCDTGTCVGGQRAGDACAVDSDCRRPISVFHQAVVPGGNYGFQSINQICDVSGEQNFTTAFSFETSIWGDTVLNCAVDPCGPPNGQVDVITDTVAILDKFQNLAGAPSKDRVDLSPDTPDHQITISDVTWDLGAFSGGLYPFGVASPCP